MEVTAFPTSPVVGVANLQSVSDAQPKLADSAMKTVHPCEDLSFKNEYSLAAS